ncbi:hypothetical protein F4776DRAFT_666560 [Hypoxylon sp. NC0597]|nr:hypothetical protein F4776DRAFT_666560 [Hypoxylon sp. NC0597]
MKKPQERPHIPPEKFDSTAPRSVEFSKIERLVNHQRCRQILDCDDAEDAVRGRSIYKMFSEIVDYREAYGKTFFVWQKLVGRVNESAGLVVKARSGETWSGPFLSECFGQVGTIWVDFIADESSTNIYILNGFEQWMRSPKVLKERKQPIRATRRVACLSSSQPGSFS